MLSSQPLHFHPVILRNLQSHYKHEVPPRFFTEGWDVFSKIYASSAIFPYGNHAPENQTKAARIYVVVTQVRDGQLKRLLGSPWSLGTSKPSVQSLMQKTLFNFLLGIGTQEFLKAQSLHFETKTDALRAVPVYLNPEKSFIGVEFGDTIDLYFQLHIPDNIQLISKGEAVPEVCWDLPPIEEAIYWSNGLTSDRVSPFLPALPVGMERLYIEHNSGFRPRPGNQPRPMG